MQGSLPNLTLITDALNSHAQTMADELATFFAGQADDTMKHPTGTFRDSLSGEAQTGGDGVSLRVVSSDPLARVKLEPTTDHEIPSGAPRTRANGPMLHFNWMGGEAFFSHVHHPGTVGWGVVVESLMERAFEVVSDEWPSIVQEAAIE